MRVQLFIFAAALLLPTTASATPPPHEPLTSCTAVLCFDLDPTPSIIVSKHVPATGAVVTTMHVAPGVTIGLVSRPAESVVGSRASSFRWQKRSDRLVVASACIGCDGESPWSAQWVGVALSATSAAALDSYLAEARLGIRQIELHGFYADTSPALRTSEPINVFGENRKLGVWQW